PLEQSASGRAASSHGQEEYPAIDAGSGGTEVFGCPPQDFGEISFGFGAKTRMPPPSRRVKLSPRLADDRCLTYFGQVTFELGKRFERSAFAPFGGFDPGLGGAQGVQSAASSASGCSTRRRPSGRTSLAL